MSETATNEAIQKYLGSVWCPQRIESRVTGPGIADLWAGDVAIESKCLPAYPKSIATPIKLKHELTLEQYRWNTGRWRNGWKSYVILQARRLEWYLFAAPDAYVLVPGHQVPLIQLKAQALWYSDKGIENTYFSRSSEFLSLKQWLVRAVDDVDRDREEHGLVARWQDI
jgi:hypothetical protein